MIVTSSTTHSHWFKCPHSHWLYAYEGGTGIVNKEASMHTLFGTAIHDGAEGLMMGKTLDEVTRELKSALAAEDMGSTPDDLPRHVELYWLGYGLLRACRDFLIPRIEQIYTVEHIEQEYVIPLPLRSPQPTVHWMCKPDCVLSRISDNAWLNGNIKTTGYMNDIGAIYEFSVQMLMEALAVQLNRKLETGGSVIIALNKGQKGKLNKRDKEAGRTGFRMESPFTYVWWKKETYSFSWSYNAEKIGVWNICGDPDEWYKKLPQGVADSQVDFSAPIDHSRSIDLHGLLDQIVEIEHQVAGGFHARNYDACNSYSTFNRPCDYKLWCHGTDQEKQDNFQPRRAHHPHEIRIQDMLKEGEL